MTLEQRLEQIGGCGDGNCKVYVRPGQHTNGGCRCLRHDPIKAERVISAYGAEVDRLTAQLAEREGIARELANALTANAAVIGEHADHDEVILADAALARFHAAEGEP